MEEEALDLEELLAKSREKAEATKAARDRVARLRRELEAFESEQHQHQDSDQDHDQEPLGFQPTSTPAAPDVASALATSLQAAVITIDCSVLHLMFLNLSKVSTSLLFI